MPLLKLIKGDEAGKTFDLKAMLTVGRSTQNNICLPDRRASRKHALVIGVLLVIAMRVGEVE